MEKIKVALICHFSNTLVRDHLNLYGDNNKFFDFSNWITNIINGLKKHSDIELHVIAPHPSMKSPIQIFEIEGVSYYFFRKAYPFLLEQIEERLGLQRLRNYPRNRKYIRDFLSMINPDVVNLIGAENPYYSSAALDINNKPIILHCQTVYANPERMKKAANISRQRWKIEIELFQKIKYIACTGRMYYNLVKSYSPEAFIFPRVWPPSPFPLVKDVPKKYDFVYFARYLNRNKGFDNAIEAIGLAVKKHPELKFLAVGTWGEDKSHFEKRIRELGIEDNIQILPSFPKYIDMLQCVKQAKFALLPIKMDVVSGTILEAMRLGLPVVTSRTSGTPALNEKYETVLISDIDDCDKLSMNIIKLYEDEELANRLKNNSFQYLKEKDEISARNTDIMIAQYKAVIDHYNNGTPIPEYLLYKTEEIKDYRN